MKAPYSIKFLLIVLVLSQTAIVVCAQNSKEEKYYTNSHRHWLVEIPIWVPGFRGQLAYGDFDLSSSGSDEEREFERINSDVGLEFYFVGRIAAQYNKLWIQADAFSGEVGAAFSYTSLIGNNEREILNIKIQGTIPRLSLGYSVLQKSTENSFKLELIPYVGIRYVSFHLQSDVFDSTYVIDVRPNWFEPLIGLYVPIVYKRFKIEVQVDYGNSGTNNSWVLSNRYRYRISKLVDVQLGWNLIRLYHKGNVGSNELESTIRLFGPTAGIGFRF
jgi:hypothetical protein